MLINVKLLVLYFLRTSFASLASFLDVLDLFMNLLRRTLFLEDVSFSWFLLSSAEKPPCEKENDEYEEESKCEHCP